MENNNQLDQELEETRKEVESMIAEMRMRQESHDVDENISGNSWMKPSNITRRKDVVFTEEEQKLFDYISNRINELAIGRCRGDFLERDLNVSSIYIILPDELRDELLQHTITYKDGRRFKYRGKQQCILRYLAYEEDYPSEISDEILNCIYILQNPSKSLNSENKVVVEGVLEGLVNYNWNGADRIFIKSLKEIKKAMDSIVGQESAVEQLLKCYNILSHTHKTGPHVIRIKADAGMGVDTLVKTFAGAIGRYSEISCQNLGLDPEVTAGSSRIYCNSTPGELGEAIINNEVQTIIMKNVNDADDRNIARLSAFFENTFVDNYYRVRVPGDVLVICTESSSGKKTPEYLFRDAYTIELTEYSEDECKRIVDSMIERFNTEFGLELSFDESALKKVAESKSPKAMHKMLLDVFSDISFSNEMSSEDSITNKKTITVDDFK